MPVRGPRGMRPAVPFMPSSPQNPAGMRIDPPPSPPEAMVTRPPATAAELPADDPPAVRPCCHGLWVTPLSLVTLTLSPPNSLAVVCPTGTAPAAWMRCIMVEVNVARRSANTSDASVAGHPSTESSSFTPIGTPPKGCDTSADAAASRARSSST